MPPNRIENYPIGLESMAVPAVPETVRFVWPTRLQARRAGGESQDPKAGEYSR